MTEPIFAAIFFLIVAPSVSVSWEHEIFVEKNGTNSSESCGSKHTPCATFNKALQGLTEKSTVIHVGPGTYTLEHGFETTISGLNKLAIIGRSKNSTIINCSPSTGLIFLSSSNITIESISFQYCGEVHFPYWIGFRTAITFAYCNNVRLTHVTIQFSNGNGLLLDCVQRSIIENCTVSDSRANYISSTVYGIFLIGGGIIFTGRCNMSVIGSHFIHSSIITSNDFHYYTPPHYNNFYYCPNHMGGGITLISFNASYHLVIDSSVITNNTRGLSMFKVSNGSVQITNTSIYSNVNPIDVIIIPSPYLFSFHLIDNNVTDKIILAFHPKVDVTVRNYPSEYIVKSDSLLEFGYYFSNTENYGNFPAVQLKQTQCHDDNDFNSVEWGICFETTSNSTVHCPASYSYCDPIIGCSCAYTRRGRLCGQCYHGYSVVINSNHLSCVYCGKHETVVKGWALLIALEFIPITVMVILIAVLNINLNQGSLNAYIFFCQIMTISFPSVGYPAWLISHDYQRKYSPYLLPMSIWNLNFINIPSSHFSKVLYEIPYDFTIQISKKTSPLGALSFWYFMPFYALTVLTVISAGVVLYGKGYRCAVCLFRPFHRCLARFWRMFNIQPSLTHTAASLFTLCFVQLAAVSFKILHPAWYEDEHGKYHSVFFYDGTQPYFRYWHGLAGTVAVMVLTFLSIVTLYLLIHPFQWFQKCLNKVKFKKDFLISVTDAFTGPYKDGTENSWDYRFFAGVHFALRLITMVFYYIPHDYIIAGLEATLCVLTATAIIIFRPYKRNIHSFNNMFLLFVLGAFGLYPLYSRRKLAEEYDPYYKFFILPLCGFIVILVVTPYCIYWVIKKMRAGYRYLPFFSLRSINHHQRDNEHLDPPEDDDGLLADHTRLMNPEMYDERHVPMIPKTCDSEDSTLNKRSSFYETLD